MYQQFQVRTQALSCWVKTVFPLENLLQRILLIRVLAGPVIVSNSTTSSSSGRVRGYVYEHCCNLRPALQRWRIARRIQVRRGGMLVCLVCIANRTRFREEQHSTSGDCCIRRWWIRGVWDRHTRRWIWLFCDGHNFMKVDLPDNSALSVRAGTVEETQWVHGMCDTHKRDNGDPVRKKSVENGVYHFSLLTSFLSPWTWNDLPTSYGRRSDGRKAINSVIQITISNFVKI